MGKHVWTEGERKNMQAYWDSNPKPRLNLMKFCQKFNPLNPFPKTPDSWEYIFYDRMLDDEMVDFMLQMKLRKNYTIDELAELTGNSIEKTAEIVARCIHAGPLEYYSDKNEPDAPDRVYLEVFAPGANENTAMSQDLCEKYPEVATAYKNFILDMSQSVAGITPMGRAPLRSIPVEKAIQNESRRVKYEEISYWLDKCGDSLAASECECRKFREMTEEGSEGLRGEWCIQLGRHAEHAIRTGKARRITREEAEAIVKKAEELGYVHQLSNIDGPDYSIFLCNCDWRDCNSLKMSWYTNSPNFNASNYRANVNPKNCVACGGCVEVCPMNAVKLGQKICQKSPVEIKDTVTPKDRLLYTSKNFRGDDFLYNRANVVKETGTAPCKSNCPAHIAVQGYVKMAGMGRYDEALALIKKENPFPAVCGSICARFCEQVCTRGDLDAPVAIDEIKKFLAQRELKKEQRYIPEKKYDRGHKVAIIGAGPAGLTCAYYAAVYGHDVTVFEKEALPGGMMTYGIPNFRLEKDVVNAEIEVLKELGVEIKCGIEVGKDVTLQQLREEGYKGFYVAIGAQGGRKLGVPGEEDSKDVISGIDFLRSVGNKTNEKLPKKVVVIGGGNVAIDVARTALRQGAQEITMLCLEQRNEMPAAEEEIEETLAENIKIECGWGPKEIVVKNGKVTGIVMKKCLSVKDEKGMFNPQYDEQDTLEIECSTVLAAIGQSIQWGALLDGSKVVVGRGARAEADSWTYQTAEPDVFVGGDVYTGPRFLIDAIAAGKEGANSLHRFVWEGHDLTRGRIKRDNFHYIDKDNLNIGSYNNASRCRPAIDKNKAGTMSDERLCLTEDQVRTEASRCLECGAARVDKNMCIGCGVCTVQCKFDAITLHKEYDVYATELPYIKLAFAEELGRKAVRSAARIAQNAVYETGGSKKLK